jgi:hypothetical protein
MTTTYNPDPTTYTVAARVGGSARCPGTQGQVRGNTDISQLARFSNQASVHGPWIRSRRSAGAG